MAPVTRRSPDGSSGRASKHATATACNTSTKQLKNRCHAGVVVTQVHTGGYEAIICRNHGGHVPRDDPRSQLPLSQACRTFIENELAAGLPRSLVLQHFDAVAHDVRHRASSLPGLFSGRDLGLSAKDVANVEADLLGLRSYVPSRVTLRHQRPHLPPLFVSARAPTRNNYRPRLLSWRLLVLTTPLCTTNYSVKHPLQRMKPLA